MFHIMSMERGWSHEEMMHMSKRTFLRYYGYWYSEKFNEGMQLEWDEAKRKAESKLKN